jgi:hypothetical protein
VDEDRVETTHGDVSFHASGGERKVVLGPQSLHVGRSQTVTVEQGSRVVEVMQGEHVLLSAGRLLLSQGGENHFVLHTDGEAEEKKGARIVTPHAIELIAGDAKISMNADGAGTIEITSPKEIKIVVEGSTLSATPPAIKVNQKTHPAAG